MSATLAVNVAGCARPSPGPGGQPDPPSAPRPTPHASRRRLAARCMRTRLACSHSHVTNLIQQMSKGTSATRNTGMPRPQRRSACSSAREVAGERPPVLQARRTCGLLRHEACIRLSSHPAQHGRSLASVASVQTAREAAGRQRFRVCPDADRKVPHSQRTDFANSWIPVRMSQNMCSFHPVPSEEAADSATCAPHSRVIRSFRAQGPQRTPLVALPHASCSSQYARLPKGKKDGRDSAHLHR